MQRMMRKRISYVEDSFEASCKDIKLTIKPFLITRKKVSRAIRNNLRKTAREYIFEYIKEKNFLDVAREVIQNDLQKNLHPKLKKIYPLSLCEIRMLETKEIDKADLTLPEQKENNAENTEQSQVLEQEKNIQENSEEKNSE